MYEEAELIEKAHQAMENAYCRYSGFMVGAALLCDDGTVYTGCNVENASYGASNCAERTAIFKAVSDGHKDFKAIAICGGKSLDDTVVCQPCGICRQVMSEFCDTSFEIVLGSYKAGKLAFTRKFLLDELLPFAFEL
ncbi:cytidine deaminase [Candidatus Weimeria sp. HCP3S3_B5]|uniref:cytidine deaminase n=1 Tax=Candidatus Weimeria sp. HCP3S3_B5 TaxID=3438871 RepID=UPI002A9BD6CA|nr:cytidine deaminase [Lachnospiraceae bacterium]MDY6352741.1 cytidine deaminase [Lachnospiraceae bacterium]